MPNPVRPTQPTSKPACGSCHDPALGTAPAPRPNQERAPDPYSPNLLGPQPAGTVPTIFEPSEEDRASLFRLISDPDFSLRDVAGFHNTPLPALSAWMARPDVAAELDAFEASLARKARQSALHSLPSAVRALTHITDAYTHAERHVPEAPNTEAREQRRRQSETARRSSWLLYRIARFYANPPAPRSPGRGPEALRGGEGSGSRPSHPPLEEVADTLRDILAQTKQAACLDNSAPGGTALRAVSPPPAQSSSCSSCSSSSGSLRASHPHPRMADLPASPSPHSPPQPPAIPVSLTISANGRAHHNGTHATAADTS